MSLFKINTNTGALNAYNALAKVNKLTQDSQLRLATQKRINSVADDTSAFNVGKSLEGRVAVMQAAQGNVGSAKDLLATAESSIQSINDLLNQIKSKAADANDPTKNKESLANDIKALGNEISNMLSTTDFNGTNLLSGTSFSAGFTFQTGHASGDTLTLGFSGSSGKLGTIDLSAITGATSATIAAAGTAAGTAQSKVSDALGSIGNDIQRLNVKDEYLTAAISNATSSISRLFDTDMVMEQLNATKGSIAGQASMAMLGQLNFAPQSVLSLFG